MTKNTALKNQYAQDEKELAKMLDFYSTSFSQVHKVTCMNCNRVIAVEVAPIKADGVILERKGRTLYTHNNLCLSVRRREDLNENKQPMYGYQCICGNNTLLAQVEKGEIAERTVVVNKQGQIVQDSGDIGATSPFERAQQQATIKLKQASSKKKADYETDGNMERYETFKIERVK